MADSNRKTRNILLLLLIFGGGIFLFLSSDFFRFAGEPGIIKPYSLDLVQVAAAPDGRRVEFWRHQQTDTSEVRIAAGVFHPECNLPTTFFLDIHPDSSFLSSLIPPFIGKEVMVLREKAGDTTDHYLGISLKTGKTLWQREIPISYPSDRYSLLPRTQLAAHSEGVSFWNWRSGNDISFSVLDLKTGADIHEKIFKIKYEIPELSPPSALPGGGWMVPLTRKEERGYDLMLLNKDLDEVGRFVISKPYDGKVCEDKLYLTQFGEEEILEIDHGSGKVLRAFPFRLPPEERSKYISINGAWKSQGRMVWWVSTLFSGWIVRETEGSQLDVKKSIIRLDNRLIQIYLRSQGYTETWKFDPYVGNLPSYFPICTGAFWGPANMGLVAFWETSTDSVYVSDSLMTEATGYEGGQLLNIDGQLILSFSGNLDDALLIPDPQAPRFKYVINHVRIVNPWVPDFQYRLVNGAGNGQIVMASKAHQENRLVFRIKDGRLTEPARLDSMQKDITREFNSKVGLPPKNWKP